LALDMDKYRQLFLEESAEHLAEIGSALLELEKDVQSVESIDVIFRMAHSIKSMAASLGYDSITDVAHALEDHMEGVRSAGRVSGPAALSLLFKGLEALEQMVAVVGESGESPPPRLELIQELSAPSASAPAEPAIDAIDPSLAAVTAALQAESTPSPQPTPKKKSL
jgi:two-component system chemotaxis sensor kinase CheA